MGKTTGFMEYPRQDRAYAPVADRLQHYQEFVIPLSEGDLRRQGARCMDCGIPFCHQGCPVNNLIPDWNDLVYRGDWQRASEVLHATNNFPEFTGRVCPAPCEAACTLNLDDHPVTIKTIECAIVDRAWEEGWLQPLIPAHRTGRRIAVVGSGPAGLACAQQLARVGHKVHVYEKSDRIGGLLRYGIPDFKLEKFHIDRRIAQMHAEGVAFHTQTHVGVDLPVSRLLDDFDALVLAGGAEQPRDLAIPGRDLAGIHFALDFLQPQNRWVAGDRLDLVAAAGKRVVVIGGGDTGSDCIGTANRQGAASVTQLEILPRPPEKEDKALTWPLWPNRLRTSSSHDEGCERRWSVATQAFLDDGQGRVRAIACVQVEWTRDATGAWRMTEVPGSEFELEADLVFLAMGFIHPVREGLLASLRVELDGRGNVLSATEGPQAYYTSVPRVFTAGDMRRGQSLVVWAIREGRQCARAVDEYLMGRSDLPR